MLRRWLTAQGSDWMPCTFFALLGGVLRAVHVVQPSLTYAEAPSLQFAYTGFHSLIQSVLTQYQAPPLYYVMVQLTTVLLPPVLSARLPALLAGVGLIVVTYLLARLLGGTIAASVAGALVALSPAAVWNSHVGGNFEVGACLALLASVLLVMALRHGGWWTAAYALALCLALYADFTSLLVIVAQGILLVWLLLRARHVPSILRAGAGGAYSAVLKGRLRDCLAAYAAGLLFVVPWFLFLPSPSPLLPHGRVGWTGIQWATQAVTQSLGLNANYAHLSVTLPFAASVAILVGYTDAAALVVATALWVPARRERLVPLCLLALVPIGIEAILAALNIPIASPDGAAVMLLPGLAVVAGKATELVYHYAAGSPGAAEPIEGPAASSAAIVGRSRLAAWRTSVMVLLAVTILVGGANATWLAVETRGTTGEHWDHIASELASSVTVDDVVIYYPLSVAPVVEAYLPPDVTWLGQQEGLNPQSTSITRFNFARWMAGHAHTWIVYDAVPGANMPTQDAWLQRQGYCRLQGDPSAANGLLEYAPCGGT